MHDSARPHGTLNRRRLLTISGQPLPALGLSQPIPVNLLAEERLPDLPDGLQRMGRNISPHAFISDHPYVQPLLGLMDEQPALVGRSLDDLHQQARQAHGSPFER